MKDLYNPDDEESEYLEYVDANNLYRWTTINNLPTHGFLWKKAEEGISFGGRCGVSKRAA